MKIGAVCVEKIYPDLRVGWPEKMVEEKRLHIVLCAGYGS
jgi:hypothetical protein